MKAPMSDKRIYDQASQVDADKGVVSVEGPDEVDVKLTADAAAETSDRLLVGSMKAHGQLIQEKKKRRPSELETK
jgi:hypothetical protein